MGKHSVSTRFGISYLARLMDALGIIIWMTSLCLYLEPVSHLTLSTPRQLPVVCDVIQLYDLTMFVS